MVPPWLSGSYQPRLALVAGEGGGWAGTPTGGPGFLGPASTAGFKAAVRRDEGGHCALLNWICYEVVCPTGHTLNHITLRWPCAPTRARAEFRTPVVVVVVELEVGLVRWWW